MKKTDFLFVGLLATLVVGLLLFARGQTGSADQIPAPKTPTALPISTVTSVLPTPSPESCVSVHEISFCVKGVALTRDFTYVLLEIKTSGDIESDGFGFMLPSGPIHETRTTLQDDSGRQYTPTDTDKSFNVFPGAGGHTYQQTLTFPAIESGARVSTLKFTAITFFIPLQSSIQLDLGQNPRPGQVLPLSQTLDLHGQEIRMNRAELSGDGTNSLAVDIWSDPVRLSTDAVALVPKLGIPAGTGMGTGFGSKWILPGQPYHAFAELTRPGEKPVSGPIDIPVEGMSLYFEGDYEIQFPIPESGLHSDLAPTLDQLAQMAEIRRFAGSADLGIYFITFESVNNNLWSALYFGRDGSRYWVEAKTNRIVQFEGGSMPTSPAATQKSDAELKELAQGFALVNSLKFQRLSSDLVLSDRPEGSLRVFRWEYSTKTNTGSEPPFIQITMLGDGTVTGYTDTLDFPEP